MVARRGTVLGGARTPKANADEVKQEGNPSDTEETNSVSEGNSRVPNPSDEKQGEEKPKDEKPKDEKQEKPKLSPAELRKQLAGNFGGAMKLASEIDRENVNRLVLVHGDSGAGKTHICAVCDLREGHAPLVIEFEPQGVDTILAANPDALIIQPKGLGKQDDPEDGSARHLFLDLKKNPKKWHDAGVYRIAIDSLHVYQKMLAREILAEKNAARKEDDKNPLDRLAMDDYGTLLSKMERFLEFLRGLDFEVLVVCISSTLERKDALPDKGLGLIGQIVKDIPGYFNAVGYAYRYATAGTDKVERYVVFNASERITCKPHEGLTGIVAPDSSAWFDAMGNGTRLALDKAKLPPELRAGSSGTGKGKVL